MIDGNFFDQPVKITAGQGDDYTTGFLLSYFYFKEQYKMTIIELSKQQAFHADPKATQQINFTRNCEQARDATMFFIIENAKETILHFSQGTLKVL